MGRAENHDKSLIDLYNIQVAETCGLHQAAL